MCDLYCWHDPQDTAEHESLRALVAAAMAQPLDVEILTKQQLIQEITQAALREIRESSEALDIWESEGGR